MQRNARSRTADDTGSWKHDRYDENASARGPRRAGPGRPLSFPRDPAETNEVKATGKLFIENLHWDVSEQDLKTLFEQIGPVAKAYIKVSLSALDEKGVVLIQVALGFSTIEVTDRLVGQWWCTTIPIMRSRPRTSMTVQKPKDR